MEKPEDLFSSYVNSAVIEISNPRIRSLKKAAQACNLDFTRIDLNGVNTKEDFLKQLAQALQFPAYFGMNWDALDELLTDLSWKTAGGYVILFTGFQAVYENLAAEIPAIKSIFETSVSYWKQKEVTFFILLS